MGCVSSTKVSFTQFCCSGEQFDPAQGEDYAVNTDESPPNGVPDEVQIKPAQVVRDSFESVQKIKAKTAAIPLSDSNEALRQSKLMEKSQSAQNLRLCVVTSTVLPKGKVININALGAEGSLRNARDGRTYFGCKKREQKGDKSAEVINDVLIPAADRELMEKHRGRHFQVEFDPFRDAYFIKDLGNGFGAFVRLDSELFLRDNNLLHIGESFVVVNLTPGSSKLRLKLFGGPSTGEVFYFAPQNATDSRIRVGRHPVCEVPINDALISKVQFSIQFEEEAGWVLFDGDLDHQRQSTNGTWVYLSDEYEVYNGMVFKVSSTVFQTMLWI